MCPAAENLADRVMARCDELATCSEDKDCITRRFLTAPMHDVHDRMRSWMSSANLETRVDNAGNIIGRLVAQGARQTLILGSHLDSVPGAGRYDGILGVLIGLAVAEAVGDRSLPFHLDVIGFSEEEGIRYNMPYLGSAGVAGTFESAWLERIDSDGVVLRDVLSQFQLDADRIADAAYPVEQVLGFVEPHLEQGPMLEQAMLPLGVVSGIAGQTRMRVEFSGEAGHAGTTPMIGRRDALVMAAEFIAEVHTIGRRTAGLRATVGRVAVCPNAPNVIPGRVELSLDVRHMDDLTLERALNQMLTVGDRICAAANGSFSVIEKTSQQAVAMNAPLSGVLADSIRDCGHEPLDLFSGAGHDAVVMAKRFPTAMLFLRHPGGVSHHPDERVDREDVAVAIEVLQRFVLQLSDKYEPNQVSSK